MNLLTLTNRYYIFIALILVLATNTYIVFRVIHFVDNETREHMLFEKERIIKQLSGQSFINNKKFNFGDFAEVTPIDRLTRLGNVFNDTSFYDANEFEIVPFTQLITQAPIHGKFFQIKIRRRLTENEDIFSSIALPFIFTGCLIIISFLLLNIWFSKTKFKPFHSALEGLKRFDLSKNDKLNLLETNINEFKFLNDELIKLTSKVKNDYKNLKEFTENVSHETKVPIAVVQSRLELLLQSPNLAALEKNQISSALDAIHRLTKKNNTLLLLSRIDSNSYLSTTKIDLISLISKLLEEMQDFIGYKNLKLDVVKSNKIVLDANSELIEILFTNLLANAIKYNIQGGQLSIKISNNSLCISNSGEPLKIAASEMFERYRKSDHPESEGLGLAIAKKICDHYAYQLRYEYKNDSHYFYVTFFR